MYGEDIDLSYRIVQAGFKNYYFPETKIIHYKGESTKKGSLNYVRTFYQAMIIFTQKHFSGRQRGLFIAMLQAAIWLRAGITLAKNLFQRIWMPLLDAAVVYGGLVFLKDFWAHYYYKDPGYFKPDIFWFNFPLYTAVWLLFVWLNGGYDDRYDLRRLLRGIAFGSLALAAVYGFLDESHRTSRALLLLGAAWSAGALMALRLFLHFVHYRHFRIGRERPRNLVIAGSAAESARVQALLNQVPLPKNVIGTVSPDEASDDRTFLSSLSQLDDVVRIYRVDEVIFCSRDVPAHDIMTWMTRLGPAVSYKIVPEESLSIIGSSDKNAPGELYTIDIRYNIAQPGERRNKRFLDLLVCLLLLLTAPFVLAFSRKRTSFIEGWFPVLIGRKTWVGYAPHPNNDALPPLKPGVFSPVDALQGLPATPHTVERLNFLYAKDWRMERDLELLAG